MKPPRAAVHAALEPGPLWVRVLLIGAIAVSIAGAVGATVPGVTWTLPVEAICTVIFAAEYAARLWTAPERTPAVTRAALARQPALMLDLLGLLPLPLLLLTPGMTSVIVVLQMLRFLRLARYSMGLQAVGAVFVAERGPLLASLVIGGGMLLMAATGMYLLEGAAQPDRLGSIPLAMYWAVITLATVGYGDVYPVTAAGKIFAGLSAVSGIVFFALPVAIIATGFLEQIRRRDFIVSYGMVARVPLFAGLNAAAVAELTAMLKARRVQKDAIILRQGETGDGMFFIASGQVEVVLPDRLVTLQDGNFFGEAAVLGNTRRNATVIARTRCELLGLDAADVLRLAGKYPAVGAALRAAAAARDRKP